MKLVRIEAEKIAGVLLALQMQRCQPVLDVRRQLNGIDRIKNAALQRLQVPVLTQFAAPVKNGVRFAPCRHQAGIGQHLQVVTEGGLSNVKYRAQLRDPE